MNEPRIATGEERGTIALSFYDHKRQSYGHLPIDRDEEFMVGDYGDGSGGVDKGGEFKITLIRLQSRRGTRTTLTPHLEVFGDALGSLNAALALGLGEVLERDYESSDDFSAALVGIGITDRSAYPVGHKPVCPCCGKPTT